MSPALADIGIALGAAMLVTAGVLAYLRGMFTRSPGAARSTASEEAAPEPARR
jgi:hypothetical protein